MAIKEKKTVKQKLKCDIKNHKSLFIMLAIPVVITVIFRYIPLYGIQIAFKDYNPIGSIWDAKLVGFKHFERFFNYYGLKELIVNTLLLNTYDLAVSPMPVILALCLHYLPFPKLQSALRQISIMPNFVSTVVLCGIIMKFFTSGGLFDVIMQLFGAESVNYLANADNFRSIYVWSGVWQNMGYSSLMYAAALLSVPKEEHEAALLDGASVFHRMWNIDIPYLLPIYGVNLMISFGGILSNNYTKILLLQNQINLSKSQVLSTYTYEIAFEGIMPQYSLATAIGIATGIVNLILLLTVKKIVKKWEDPNE